jgi:DnaJ domain/CSL zinc finger
MSTKSLYAVLGTNPGVSSSELRAAYVAAALAAHPDKGGSAETFTAVQLAWEALRDMSEADLASAAAATTTTTMNDSVNIDVPRFTRVPIRDIVSLCEWTAVLVVIVEGTSSSTERMIMSCRCGGNYHLSHIDVISIRGGHSITAACDSCSLSVDAVL